MMNVYYTLCILLLYIDSLVLVIVLAELDTSKVDQQTVADLSIQAVRRIPLGLRMVSAVHNNNGSYFARGKDVVALTSMLVMTRLLESATVG